MNLIVKARARLDLKNHWVYIARDNLPAADRLLDAVEETFRLIADNPDLGSQRSFRKVVGVRSRAVTGFRKYPRLLQSTGDNGCNCAGPSWHAGSAEVLCETETMRLPSAGCHVRPKHSFSLTGTVFSATADSLTCAYVCLGQPPAEEFLNGIAVARFAAKLGRARAAFSRAPNLQSPSAVMIKDGSC